MTCIVIFEGNGQGECYSSVFLQLTAGHSMTGYSAELFSMSSTLLFAAECGDTATIHGMKLNDLQYIMT